jgi:prepilin-type N-terminal cleavage/methylation domain-containing protein
MTKTSLLKKIPSFTIIELMITLLISSIVISMGYYGYFLLNDQFNKYQARREKIREYELLATAFQTDFDKADRVIDTLDDHHFVFYRQDTPIRYSIGRNSVVREFGQARDSFAMTASVSGIYYVNDTNRLIDGIRLNLSFNGTSVFLSGKRIYSAAEIMLAEKSIHD